MAITPRTGQQGEVFLGFQETYGTRLAAFNQLVPRSFSISGTTLNPRQTFEDPDAKTQSGARPNRVEGPRADAGDISGLIKASDIPYWLLAWLNTSRAVYSNRDPLSVAPLIGVPTTPTAFSGNENVSTAASGNFPNLFGGTAKSFGSYPARLRVTFSVATTAPGTIIVSGTRRSGYQTADTQGDVEAFSIPTGSQTNVELGKWQSIDKVDFIGFGTATGTATLSVVGAASKRSGLKLNVDNTQSPGLGIQGILSDIPFVADDAIVNRLQLRLGANIEYVASILAGNVQWYRMMNSLTTRKVKYDATGIADAAKSGFSPAADTFLPSWGVLFEYGNVLDHDDAFVPISSHVITTRAVTLDLNHNYEPRGGARGTRKQGRPRGTADGRTITVNLNTDFESGEATDTFPEFQEDATSNKNRALRISWLGVDGDGLFQYITALIRNAQYIETPEISSDDRGQIEQAITWEARQPEGATTPSEIEFETLT